MFPSHDVVVVGLGVMGSGIAAELAQAGRRVLGVEQGWPAHDRGSSGGESRMLRRAYPEHPDYGELTEAARAAWRRLEATTDSTLFLPTGGLLVGPVGSARLAATLEAADQVPHQVLSVAQLRRSYPALRFDPDTEGFLDEEAGVLLAEPCVRAFQRAAVEAGAELRFGAAVELDDLLGRWNDDRVLEIGGTRIKANTVVLAVGSWLGRMATATDWPRVTVERTTSHWLAAGRHAAALGPRHMPFVVWDDPRGEFCMLPSLGDTVMVKFHHTGETAEPGSDLRPVDEGECATARRRLGELAGLHLDHRRAQAATYTNTVDRRFLIAPHPEATDVMVVSACSGHGFKFAPIIANAVASAINYPNYVKGEGSILRRVVFEGLRDVD